MRNILIPFLTSVLTLSLMVFVSCAHSTPTEGEESLEISENTEETPADETEASGEVAAAPAEGEAPPADLASAAEPKPEEASVQDSASAGTATADEMLNELEGTPPPAVAQTEAPAVSEVPPDLAAAPSSGSADGGVSLPSISMASGPITSRLPRIPKVAIQKGGASLNRFYFVRKGDTVGSLGTLLLGAAAKGGQLQRWNSGKLKPGKLLYYSSPVDPSDKNMQSFYQERNVPSEPYKIGRGDWLSKIASKRYGSPMSWREVAVLNGVRNPDSIENGQKILLYPTDLSGFSEMGRLAQKSEIPPAAPPPERQASVESQVPPPQAQPLDPPPQEPPSDVPPPGAQEADSGEGGGDVMGMIEQNIVFIAVGAAIVLLLIALIAIKKKKARAGAEDFGEDPMAPPKARRK